MAYTALAVVCVLWGTTYLALRVGVLNFPPFLFTVLRQCIAGVIMVGFLKFIAKIEWPSKQHLINQAIAGLLMISIGNGLVGYAEVHISSGVAAVICSMMPIWMILINLAVTSDEKPTFPILLGFGIGLSGILMIFGENLGEFSNPDYTWGIVLIFIANIGWAAGSVWMKKKNQKSNALMNAGLQMLFGGIFLIPASLAFDDYSNITWSAEAGYALLYLILFGSIAAYGCYSYAVKKLPMTIVSLYAYINPIVAVFLGAVLLGEKFNLWIGIAMAITIAGVYIVNRGFQVRNLWRAEFSK
jgi:drug/metabolite transporter (DMT)-like permease